MTDPRANTIKAIDYAEQGLIDWETLAKDALLYMSDWEVGDLLRLLDLVENNEDEET